MTLDLLEPRQTRSMNPRRVRWRNLYFTHTAGTVRSQYVYASKRTAMRRSKSFFAEWLEYLRDDLSHDDLVECADGRLIPFDEFMFAIPLPEPE